MVAMNIHADHREARGEASKKVREHPPSAREARPAGHGFTKLLPARNGAASVV